MPEDVVESQPVVPADTSSAQPVTPSEPAVDTVATIAATPAVQAVEPEVVSDDFDFTAWDGEFDSLPEAYAPVKTKYNEKRSALESNLETLRERAEEAELLFNALNDGKEDPRLSQLEAKLNDANTRYNELAEQVKKADQDFAQNEWNKFKAQNPLITNGPNSIKVIRDLLVEDWDLEMIPKLYTLPKSQMAEVRDLAKSGVPKLQAIELITLRNAVKEEKPKTAHLVVGAEQGRGNPAEIERGKLNKKVSLEEKIRDSLATNMRKER